jgi:hypothetical protein
MLAVPFRSSRPRDLFPLAVYRDVTRCHLWVFQPSARATTKSASSLIVLQNSFCGMGLKFSEAWARRLNNDVGDHVAKRQTHGRFWQRVCGSIERRFSLVSFFGGNLAVTAFGTFATLSPYKRTSSARLCTPEKCHVWNRMSASICARLAVRNASERGLCSAGARTRKLKVYRDAKARRPGAD